MSLRAPCVIQVLLPDTRQTSPWRSARAQRAQVGAGVGLGERCGRDDLAAGEPGQQRALLLVGAVERDQLAGDLGAGAERTQADVTARELLRDHAHRGLAQARAAELLGDREAEHAELGKLAQHRVRDQVVGQVPLMGGFGMVVGVAGELLADLDQRRVVERGIAVAAGRLALGEQGCDAGTHRTREAPCAQQRHRRVGLERAAQCAVGVERVDAKDLALAHRQPAGQLREVLAERRLEHQGLELAELAARLEPASPAQHLVQRLAIGGGPGKAVRTGLFALQRIACVRVLGQHGAQRALDAGEQRVRGANGLLAVFEQAVDREAGRRLRGDGLV